MSASFVRAARGPLSSGARHAIYLGSRLSGQVLVHLQLPKTIRNCVRNHVPSSIAEGTGKWYNCLYMFISTTTVVVLQIV